VNQKRSSARSQSAARLSYKATYGRFKMATASAFGWQTWNSGPFSIERRPGKEPGTVVLRFHGPFTVRDVYTSLPTMMLSKMLELEAVPGEEPPRKNILDLTECTFMDSSGLGMVASHYAHCRNKGIKMICAAMTPRVRQLFQLTKMDTVIPIAGSLEEAEADKSLRARG
jgi:anti-sigma B factor antagonist